MVDLFFKICFILLGLCCIVFLIALFMIGFDIVVELIKDMKTGRKVA